MRDVQARRAQLDARSRENQQQYEEELKKMQEQKDRVNEEIEDMQTQTALLMDSVNALRVQQKKDSDAHDAMVARAQQAINLMAQQVEQYNEGIAAAMKRADSL